MNPDPAEPLGARTRVSRGILILGVHLLLLAPLLSMLLRIPDATTLFENRPLAGAPAWHPWQVADWTTHAEAWINDHFPQRGRVVLWNSLVHERYLESASADVIVGRDGWLYYAGDGTADDILGRTPFSPEGLEQWAHVLQGRQAWLAQRGIKYLFVVVPNKSTVYPEHLPRVLQWGARPGRLDQLVAYLKLNTRVPVLDLRPPLLAAKEDRLIFWPWDSHWNGYGLTIGSDEVTKAVRQLGLRAGVDDANEWLSVRTEDRLFDCVDLLGMRGKWPVGPVPVLYMMRPPDLKVMDSPLNTLPFWSGRPPILGALVSERASGNGRVSMFSDSFFRAGGLRLEALGDLPLQVQFRRFASLWDVSDFEKISAVVRIEQPEVVVDQTTERLLGTVPPDNPEWENARLGATPP
jgi:hypothetical protein